MTAVAVNITFVPAQTVPDDEEILTDAVRTGLIVSVIAFVDEHPLALVTVIVPG
ncbi:hypothetical protein D3C87_2079450 [compost metagenome]